MKGKLIVHSEQPLAMALGLFHSFASIGVEVIRRGYSQMDTEDETHLIWGMSSRLDEYKRLSQIHSTWFMENGWLTQRDGCSIDAVGSKGMSSVRGHRHPIVTKELRDEIDQWIERLHNKNRVWNSQGDTDNGYILIPLQTEKDTNMLYWSCLGSSYPIRMVRFTDMVCRMFPDRQLVFRPHPRDPLTANQVADSRAFRSHEDAVMCSDGSSFQWIKNATAVIGINSTVLIEALTFMTVPIAAIGVGVFSEHGVMIEAKGDESRLRDVLVHKPDPTTIYGFLGLLYERQVPYSLHPDEFPFFPVLTDMLNHAKAEG